MFQKDASHVLVRGNHFTANSILKSVGLVSCAFVLCCQLTYIVCILGHGELGSS